MKKYIKKLFIGLFGFSNFVLVKTLVTVKFDKLEDKEEEDFKFFLTLLKPNDIVLDIGANVGITGAMISRTVQNGRVFSFEPIPFNFKTLMKVVKYFKLKNVKAYNVALGPSKDTVEMRMPTIDGRKAYKSSFVKYVDYDYHKYDDIEVFQVNQEKLDEIVQKENITVNALKLDVENYEYYVLQGAKETLVKNKPIIFSEFWYGSENQQKCFLFLEEFGYEIKVYHNGTLEIFDEKAHDKLNFFCFPKVA
jgi:FkbM family methyltransferase